MRRVVLSGNTSLTFPLQFEKIYIENVLVSCSDWLLCWQAFTMIDQNRDGLIDVRDLQAIYAQIGIYTFW